MPPIEAFGVLIEALVVEVLVVLPVDAVLVTAVAETVEVVAVVFVLDADEVPVVAVGLTVVPAEVVAPDAALPGVETVVDALDVEVAGVVDTEADVVDVAEAERLDIASPVLVCTAVLSPVLEPVVLMTVPLADTESARPESAITDIAKINMLFLILPSLQYNLKV